MRTKDGYRPSSPCEHAESADVLLREGGLYSGNEETRSAGYRSGFDGRADGIFGLVSVILREKLVCCVVARHIGENWRRQAV